MKVWTQKFGQWLSMACGVDFVQIFVREDRLQSNVPKFSSHESLKLSAKTASEDCMLFLFKSQFLSMTKCWVYLISTGTRLAVLSARYEYLTVENSSNLSSIRVVWQVSRIGAPFTEKKIETKITAANAGCRNKMKARQRKISRHPLSSTLRHSFSKKTEV